MSTSLSTWVFVVCGVAVVAGDCSRVAADIHLVPDEFPKIQSAIDAAAAGDTILVAEGTYHERIRLSAGITLRSLGDETTGETGLLRAERTVIDGGGDAGSGPGVQMAQDCVLDGFTVTHVGVYDDALWQQHHATQGNEQHHEHIGNFGAPAVGIEGVSCVVRNNIVHHNGDTGIGIRGDAGSTCAPIIELNICFRNMGGGIGVMDQAGGIIRGNRCYQNFYAGIGHNHASPLVSENVCFENIRAGIGISEGSCPVVRDNICHHNRRAGIGIRTGNETQPVVERNECFENDMAGIGCEDHAAPIIRGNHCHHNRMAGIGTQDASQPVIVDNVCEHNDQSGIGVQGQADALLIRNQCLDNTLVAVGIVEQSRALLVENVCRRAAGVPPLIAIRQASTATLLQNDLQGGGVACVLVEGTATLQDNTLAADQPGTGTGVWGWKESQLIISNNRFNEFAVATKAAEAEVRFIGNVVEQPAPPAVELSQQTVPPLVVGNVFAVPGTRDQVIQVDAAAPPFEQNEFHQPSEAAGPR